MRRSSLRATLCCAVAGLALLAGSATAQQADLDTHGMTPEQIHQLQIQADQLKQQAVEQAPAVRAEKISEYAQIGKGVAEALGSAAKELNVAVNDFAKTPVGQLTVWLIIFKVVEARVIHVGAALLWTLFFTPIWYSFYRKCWQGVTVIEYGEDGKKKRVTKSPPVIRDSDQDQLLGWRLAGGVVGVCAAVIGLIVMVTT